MRDGYHETCEASLPAGAVGTLRVAALVSRLRTDGHRLVFLGICVGEAISVVEPDSGMDQP